MYKVKLEIFEGPLDLLLYLIKKNEVDIYNIPIAVITEQYLEYIEMMKTLNLDMAGEFLLMAATLVHIKSRMLLPPSEETEEEEGEDPRGELVRRLLEYQRYKDAASVLEDRIVLGRDVFARGPLPLEGMEEEVGLLDVSIFTLMEALKDVLERAPKEVVVDVTVEKTTITDKINLIMEFLEEKGGITFYSLFPTGVKRADIILTFLALLELVRMRMVKVYQSQMDGVIRVYVPDKGSEFRVESLEG